MSNGSNGSGNANDVRVEISTETTVEHFATAIVNGSNKGKRKINGGPSLLDFCQNLAQETGNRTFTVTYNGSPVTDADVASKTIVKEGDVVAVQAKDSRGGEIAEDIASDDIEWEDEIEEEDEGEKDDE